MTVKGCVLYGNGFIRKLRCSGMKASLVWQSGTHACATPLAQTGHLRYWCSAAFLSELVLGYVAPAFVCWRPCITPYYCKCNSLLLVLAVEQRPCTSTWLQPLHALTTLRWMAKRLCQAKHPYIVVVCTVMSAWPHRARFWVQVALR